MEPACGWLEGRSIYLTLGNLSKALTYAQESVGKADLSGDFRQVDKRMFLTDVLHNMGRLKKAEAIFHEAEGMQRKIKQRFALLYHHCDLLLSQGRYLEVQEYLNLQNQVLDWDKLEKPLLYIALEQLALGRVYLEAQQSTDESFLSKSKDYLEKAVDGLRWASYQDYLPIGLLALAKLYRVMEELERAQRNLDEAVTIATRGSMGLHQADCHLEYARLYLAMGEKDKARESLAIAKKMIEEMGYHRRDNEVRDLEEKLTH